MSLSTAAFELSEAEPLEFDCVVIGSGYGGSVMAARLAGLFPKGRLAVLERGLERPSSSFPRNGLGLLRELRSAAKPFGLFDFTPGRDYDVMRANGLGGTSLINAGVMLEPAPLHEIDADWPEELRGGELAPYSNRVRSVLGVEKIWDRDDADVAKAGLHLDYLGRPHRFRPSLEKTRGFAQALRGAAVKAPAEKAPLAVNLSASAGRPYCTLCGDCVTGCPTGGKNTLDRSYLPIASRLGARILTAIHTESIEPLSNTGSVSPYRYRVHAHTWKKAGSRFGRHDLKILARSVVLAAGSLGSSEILLRSVRRHGVRTSAMLGHGFSGNADTFALGLARPGRKAPPSPELGTTIVSSADLRETHGILLQEGSIPSALEPLLTRVFGNFDRARSLVWLAMGYDRSQGRLSLNEREELELRWEDSDRGGALQGARELFRELSKAANLELHENPREALSLFGKRGGTPVTVHPLGGCAMADFAEKGCVDSAGRLYTGDRNKTWPGFYVMDGSVCRGSVGVNPALTIASLAERAAAKIRDEDRALLCC